MQRKRKKERERRGKKDFRSGMETAFEI